MLHGMIIVTLHICSIRPKIVLQNSNIFLDVKEHMSCVSID